MECLKKFNKSIVLSTLLLIAPSVYSQRVVTDPKTTAQVALNLTWQLAVENEHNEVLDTISKKEEEILFKTGQIALFKELNKQTLENVKGFGNESMYYKEIAITFAKQADLISQIYAAYYQSSFWGKANAMKAFTDLMLKRVQLVSDYIGIVTNCTVSFSNSKGKKDNHNLLDRYERMDLASKICYDMKSIKNQLYKILFLLQHGNSLDLLKQIDHKTWAYLNHGKSISEKLVKQWNNQIK